MTPFQEDQLIKWVESVGNTMKIMSETIQSLEKVVNKLNIEIKQIKEGKL